MGNLTGLLDKIKPAIAVARSNVQQTIAAGRGGSPILHDLESKGQIRMVGAMYELKGGAVKFS
ncbi:hypothetical protein [Paraburkholderia rhizosphaerae]|uniref:hypothetical protein n=1 Tax=Paraburkholderia rhizosphaerae TaxID=480658 RepID=UPI00106532E3|nr:hypothetical protein [Paraburkholderia rhizosphaerae]